jgi:hypothetical protein
MDSLMMLISQEHKGRCATTYLGLAPFLRANLAGNDLLPFTQELLIRAEKHSDDAELLMNLAIALQCVGHRDLGLRFQEQALQIRRVYSLEASEQSTQLRVLMLMVPGDIAENTPLECLFETCDIELIHYYLTAGDPLAAPIPDHDIVVVALAESEEHRSILDGLETALTHWPKPILNAPQHIPKTDRNVASELLQNVPGLLIPQTLRASRSLLRTIASGERRLANAFAESCGDCDFPIIARPVGSQAGRDLDRLESSSDLAGYLDRVAADDFFISRFIDYRSSDGMYRKYRVALIDGESFACHMGVSSHWMVHYVNAGMYEEAWKRDEEARFMENFESFAERHKAALAAIHQRVPLDYFCIDCAEMLDGRLMVFEIDHCMVVHAMDSEDMFPYKQVHMLKVKKAFENLLLRLHERSAIEAIRIEASQ